MVWKKLESVVRLELRFEEASSSSSWFEERFVLDFVSRLGATHRPLLGVGSSEKRRIDGKDRRLVSPARVEKRRRIRGSSGRTGRLDPARSRWSPGPDKLMTTRGGEVSKGLRHHFLGVCVCVRVSVGPYNQ